MQQVHIIADSTVSNQDEAGRDTVVFYAFDEHVRTSVYQYVPTI